MHEVVNHSREIVTSTLIILRLPLDLYFALQGPHQLACTRTTSDFKGLTYADNIRKDLFHPFRKVFHIGIAFSFQCNARSHVRGRADVQDRSGYARISSLELSGRTATTIPNCILILN